MPRVLKFTSAAIGIVALTLAAKAQTASSAAPEALFWMRQKVNEQVQRAPWLWSLKQVNAMLRPQFAAVSRDGKKITAADREATLNNPRIEMRLQFLRQFLRADISGAGRVDRDMLRDVFRRDMTAAMANASSQVSAQIDKQIDTQVETFFSSADRDKDGFVTYAEAVRASDIIADSSLAAQRGRGIPAELDLNGDGTITLEEFETVVSRVFNEIDTNQDGEISQAEAVAFQAGTMVRAQNEASLREAALFVRNEAKRKAESCGMPEWDAKSTLAYVSVLSGQSLSNTSIGGGDISAEAVNIHIEPGPTPLVLALTSLKSTIWQFSGAADRVSLVYVSNSALSGRRPYYGEKGLSEDPRVPASAGAPPANNGDSRIRSGVLGLAAEKVRLAARADCLPPAIDTQIQTFDNVTAVLGRKPEVVVGKAKVSTVRLPSGTALSDGVYPNSIVLPSSGAAASLWDAFRKQGGGLVDVDPSKVIAPLPVARTPLPGLAGLAAMVEDGSARIASWQDMSRFMTPGGQVGPTIIGGGAKVTAPAEMGNVLVTKIPQDILLLAPVTLPAGLAGHDIRRLIVARGIASPLGERGSICIVSEETSKPIEGSGRCP